MLIKNELSDQKVWEIWLSSLWQPAIAALDHVGVFSLLNKKSASAQEIAQELGLNERALTITLKLNVSLNILEYKSNDFSLSELGRKFFVPEEAFYWGHMFRINVDFKGHIVRGIISKLQQQEEFEGELPVSLGGSAPVDMWAKGDVDTESARRIASSMHSHSAIPALENSTAECYGKHQKVLDIAAGDGCFSLELCNQWEHLRCSILELPTMCSIVEENAKAMGHADRIKTYPLDMFRQEWPKGYDAHFFSNVFHDWNFKTCTWLARKSHESLPDGGKIYLNEMLLNDDGCGPIQATAFSMLMLLTTKGQQFTFFDLKKILTEAGFKDVKIEKKNSVYSLISATK